VDAAAVPDWKGLRTVFSKVSKPVYLADFAGEVRLGDRLLRVEVALDRVQEGNDVP
jgi:hypothetical protein